MELQHTKYETQLRTDLEGATAEAGALRDTIRKLEDGCTDRDRTIARFREATARLKVRACVCACVLCMTDGWEHENECGVLPSAAWCAVCAVASLTMDGCGTLAHVSRDTMPWPRNCQRVLVRANSA